MEYLKIPNEVCNTIMENLLQICSMASCGGRGDMGVAKLAERTADLLYNSVECIPEPIKWED